MGIKHRMPVISVSNELSTNLVSVDKYAASKCATFHIRNRLINPTCSVINMPNFQNYKESPTSPIQ